MTTIKSNGMEDEKTALLRASPALSMDILEALEEREPLPEEIAPDDVSRCKYLSKKCVRQRATKAKGALHKLCTFHRAKAIINQRRLELRKRVRSGGGDTYSKPTSSSDSSNTAAATISSSTTTIASIKIVATTTTTSTTERSQKRHAATTKKTNTSRRATHFMMLPAISVAHESPADCKKKTPSSSQKPSPRDVHTVHEIEPCRTPATLFPEDLEELRALVDLEIAHAERLAWNFAV